MTGRAEVATYCHNYAHNQDWRLALGLVEGRPAALVSDPGQPEAKPLYFVLLGWRGGKLLAIRDFRYARYVMADAEFSLL